MFNNEEKIKEIQIKIDDGSVTPEDLVWVLENFKRDFRPIIDEMDIIKLRKDLQNI